MVEEYETGIVHQLRDHHPNHQHDHLVDNLAGSTTPTTPTTTPATTPTTSQTINADGVEYQLEDWASDAF